MSAALGVSLLCVFHSKRALINHSGRMLTHEEQQLARILRSLNRVWLSKNLFQWLYVCCRFSNSNFLFSQPSRLLENWISEFLSHVKANRPKFIALHLQEVGGKTYEKSMEYVQEFIKVLCESEDLNDYNKIRVFLDEDYNSAEHFTVSFCFSASPPKPFALSRR
jgi:hypothetical protein